MGKNTEVSWTSHTFNPIWGCARVSEGCVNCYAEAWAKRTGFGVWGVDAPRRTFGEKHWNEPVRWNEAAQQAGRRAQVFCASMADVFEDHPTAAEEREKLWPLIAATPWLDWQLLTKRSEMIGECVPGGWLVDWPRNVWLGVTAENQRRYDERIGDLLAMPAPVRFLSHEPLVGPIRYDHPDGAVQWAIVGAESGAKRRAMDMRWATELRAEAHRTGTAFFMKQMDVDGKVTDELARFPLELRAREWPAIAERTSSSWEDEQLVENWSPGRIAPDRGA